MEISLRRILGLDLGSYAVKAVELRQTLRGVEVVQMRALSQEPGGPGEGAPSGSSFAARLRDFLRMHKLPTEWVVAALEGDRLSSRRLSLPFRDRRRVAQAVPFEVEGLVPFPLEELLVDWEIVGGDGSRSEVAAIVAQRAEVARTLDGLREAGLDPRILEAEGLALANLAALVPLAGTRVLLDLGHRKTTLCVLRDGKPLAARTLRVAGLAVTQALARERGISETDAERIKCESGIFGVRGRPDSAAALAVLDRLAREIVRTLAGLEGALGGPAVEQVNEITLFGGSARLHRVDEVLAERTGLPAARLSFPPGGAGSALLAAGDPLLFAPALALALRGSFQARTRTNFRQDEFAPRIDLREVRRELSWTLRLGALAVILFALSLGSSIFVESRRAHAAETRLASVYGAAFPGHPVPANVLQAMRDAVRSAHERADFLGVYRGNLSALDLLTEISARVPPDLDVVFEELSIDRQVVRIRGYSKSFEGVDRLKSELSKFEPFSEIQVSEIQNDPKRGGKSFSVTISLAKTGEGVAG